jgi:hypothetical protein
VKIKMVLRFHASAVGLALAAASATQPLFAQAASPLERSASEDRRRALYQEGKEAIKAQRWLDAKTKLSEAWSISPSYDVALLLSQAEFNLEHFAESARLLDYYFRNVSAKENEKTFANAKQAFEAAKAKVALVTVEAPDGLELALDGKPLGTTPLQEALYVRPGRRNFEVKRGESTSVQELQAVAGQEQSVVLPEPPSSAAPATSGVVESGLSSSPSPLPPTDARSRRSVVPLLVGGGAALVGVGLGVGFRVASSSSHDRLVELREEAGADGCSGRGAGSADCSALKDAVDTTDFRRNFSTGAFVVGGVAAIGTAVYWLWPRGDTSTAGARALRVSGYADSGGAAVWINGDF